MTPIFYNPSLTSGSFNVIVINEDCTLEFVEMVSNIVEKGGYIKVSGKIFPHMESMSGGLHA